MQNPDEHLDDSPPPSLSTLPEELLESLLLPHCGAAAAVQVAKCSQALRGLVATSDRLWQSLCEKEWSELHAVASVTEEIDDLATDGRRQQWWGGPNPPKAAWREFFSRKYCAYDKNLTLSRQYDHIVVLLHRRSNLADDWLEQLGWTLAEMLLARSKVSERRYLLLPQTPSSANVHLPQILSWRCPYPWLTNRHADEMVDAAVALSTEACALLDAWYELAGQGGISHSSESRRDLLRAFRALSALHALTWCHVDLSGPLVGLNPASHEQPWQAKRGQLARALKACTGRVAHTIRSMREEGCDISIPASVRPACVVGPAAARTHWWWHCPEPTFVSGGCPLIPPMNADCSLWEDAGSRGVLLEVGPPPEGHGL